MQSPVQSPAPSPARQHHRAIWRVVIRRDPMVDTARRRWEAGDDRGASDVLDEALDLWTGRAMAGTAGRLDHHPAVIGLNRRRVAACLRLAEIAMAQGRSQFAADRLRVVAHDEPLDEMVHSELMRALIEAGRRADALIVFIDLRRRLVEQLGIEPGPYPQRMHREILRPGARLGSVPTSQSTSQPTSHQRGVLAPGVRGAT
ncbi:AfsR/SARP family transcriptional regulator [Pseudonocardia sp. TRM90224]|uniref:AfsR/SARP family transcriptional regulator n=1 Tax=Pseudonocardia sp. TRM90224 TaxID=2812678 RepID=UPI0027E0AE42|nr:BTAD domain-containing putative transcriptional regulator [Pseudonocardia sp. TRM90224]